MSKQPRTAFVLAAGGSLGAVQAGMLRALYERGVKPGDPHADAPPRGVASGSVRLRAKGRR